MNRECPTCGERDSVAPDGVCPTCGRHFADAAYFDASHRASDATQSEPARRISVVEALIALGFPIAIMVSGNFRIEVAITFVLYSLLMLVHNLTYYVGGLLLRLEVEEFSMFFGGYVLRFKVGALPVRINWLPIGSAVKFAAADETAYGPNLSTPGKRTYLSIHPLLRLALVLSAPVIMGLIAVLLLEPTEFQDWWRHDLPKAVTALQTPNEAKEIVRGFFRRLREPGGIAWGTGILAALTTVINLIPNVASSGGLAVTEVLRALRLNAAVKAFNTVGGFVLLGVVVLVALWGVFAGGVVFGG